MRKKILVLGAVALVNSSPAPALAGSVAGNGGATEVTQWLNNAQLVNAYMQQLTAYSTQLQQYQAQLQNLARNPASMMGTDVNRLIGGIGGMMTAGNSIGGTVASIDKKFGQTFNSPTALSFSERFKQLTSTSTDTLGASMRAAGLHRDAYATDTAALQALFDKSQSSDGTVAAVQQLSAINTMQIQQTQEMKDLLATQNIATATWMAEQSAKQQQNLDSQQGSMGKRKPLKSWNSNI
jgi:P-type conjugative transfer protein TrbJ